MTLASLMDNAGKLTTSGLAVVGAFFIGAVLIGAGTNLMTRSLFGKKVPTPVLRLVRLLGGLAAGLTVGLLVFSGAGGWGLGGSGGTGGTGIDAIASSLATPPVEVKPPPTPARVGVTLLGGARVRDKAFYLLDGETTPRALEPLQDRLRAMQQPGDPPPALALRIYDDSVAQDHPAVVALEAWARQYGWRLSVEKMPGTLPVVEGDRL